MSRAAGLVVLGRLFDGFTRSLTEQLELLEVQARIELVEIEQLQARVLDGDAAFSGECDLLLVITDWLPTLIERGALVAVDAAFARRPPQGWPEAYSPSLLQLQQGPDGQTYGVAYHDGPVMLLYRTDLYNDEREKLVFRERFGYPLRPARTWREYRDQAVHFTRPADGLHGTVLAGYPDSHNNVYDFLTHLWSRGGELVTADGTPGLSNDAARSAIAFLHDLWHTDRVVDPAAAGWDSVAAGVHFAQGEAAMMVNWCGMAAMSAALHSPTHDRVGCAVTPGEDGAGGSHVTLNAYWVLAVPVGARDRDRSTQLLRDLCTDRMDKVTALSGACAVRRDTWRDPEVARTAPYYSALEAAHRHSRDVPQDTRWPQMASVLNEMMRAVVVEGEGSRALAIAHSAFADLLGGS